MQFLNDYMSSSERENAIFEAQMNRESIALDNKFSSLMQEHALRLSDIDLSVVLERYSDDDTQALFEKEMAIYMEGVKEWWAEFKAWVKKLIDKLAGKPSNDQLAAIEDAKKSSDEVELPCNVDETLKGTKSVLEIIKKRLSYRKPDGTLDKEKIEKDASGVAIATAIIGGGTVALKATKYKKSKLPEFIAPVNETLQDVNEVAQAFNDDESEGSWWKRIINAVISTLSKVKNAIMGFFGNGKSDEEKPAEGVDTNTDPKADSNGEATDENKTVSDADLKKAKQNAKTEILAQAKQYNISDPKKGNKVTLADLNDYITKLEAKYKEKNNKEFLDKVPGWKKAIKDWEDKGYTEFTIDDDVAGALPVFEAMAPIDDTIIDRELMLMTESEEADVAEFIDLVDSL